MFFLQKKQNLQFTTNFFILISNSYNYEEDFTVYQVENESNLKKIVSQSVKNSQRKTSFIDKLNNFSFGCSAKGEDSMPPQNEAANGSEANNQTENVDEIQEHSEDTLS